MWCIRGDGALHISPVGRAEIRWRLGNSLSTNSKELIHKHYNMEITMKKIYGRQWNISKGEKGPCGLRSLSFLKREKNDYYPLMMDLNRV